MNGYPILQSGFLSVTDKFLRKPPPVEVLLSDAILQKDYRKSVNPYLYSEAVDRLHKEWSVNPMLLNNFDFRERLLSLTFQLFSITAFSRWLMIQSEAPTFSDLHKMFLIETLDYLSGIRDRSTNVVQWIGLLEASPMVQSTRVDFTTYFSRPSIGSWTKGAMPALTVDVIRTWTARNGGFEDLLICLRVIFGNRLARSDVSNRSRM